MSGHRHATISLICMSTHKAMAARCLSRHQATYGQLPSGHLPRLALSVLFTIATNSYQTTCTVSERTFNKRQHANARYIVESSLSLCITTVLTLCVLCFALVLGNFPIGTTSFSGFSFLIAFNPLNAILSQASR